MFAVTHFRNLFLIPLVVVSLLSLDFNHPRPSAAQPQRSSSPNQFGGFFAPKGKGMPEDSQGGASRGICPGAVYGLESGQGLINLIAPQTTLGVSKAARPVLLAHIGPTQAKQVYFSLKNEDESYFYEQTTSLTSPGILQFELPEDAPALEVGEQYVWSVALICGNRLSPDSPWASSLIERIEVDELQTETMTPMEQATAYGRAGLWYETVESLFSMIEDQSSTSAQSALNQLLAAEGIDARIIQP